MKSPNSTREMNFRLAAARSKYQDRRRAAACDRQARILAYLHTEKLNPRERGVQKHLASVFGMCPATICGDIKAIFARAYADTHCAHCGSPLESLTPIQERALRQQSGLREWRRTHCTASWCVKLGAPPAD